MDLEGILHRVDQRLVKLGLNDNRASTLAGKKDSIRNLRRAVAQKGNRRSLNSETLAAWAPVLKTSIAWLMTGEGPETMDEQQSQPRVDTFSLDTPWKLMAIRSLVELLCFAIFRQASRDDPRIDPLPSAKHMAQLLLGTLERQPDLPPGVDPESAYRLTVDGLIRGFDPSQH
ncbi:hypothetical protein UFOVP1204_52 [uncultured Caudovirales phage]|uniref:Uncharacterized protein n=1 Tax=uncultured Caudovirales phage TaxID=2100421 RepID=A0A6J5MK07_9CAUD|nr:hypothetical protein UFOVP473_49 [uncultured Caudovirales phage]CAB4176727.1 hypothetical protein UFOVP983_49 [uncultured Caudovirales phage]CAB4190208.1 hypothetical protein UFOVP1204_52 [uncultured Caudovirales phage]